MGMLVNCGYPYTYIKKVFIKVNVKQMYGEWDLGYSLDKHTISSTPIGPNEWGHMQFDTIRPEVGEALFQLKYRSDFTQVSVIASQMYQSLSGYFSSADLIIPMPASKQRTRQPVTEIARELSRLMNIPCYEGLLVKKATTATVQIVKGKYVNKVNQGQLGLTK